MAAGSVDQMAELEERFALNTSDSQPKPAPKPQQFTQHLHDSAACQQQIATVYKEIVGEVSGNPQLEQHLLSQLHQVQGSIAKIKASYITGTAYPWQSLTVCKTPGATLSSARRLQDWMAPQAAQAAEADRQLRHNN